jgi:hypothetical protein
MVCAMKPLALAILISACIQAQPLQSLLLPEARHISGVVVDAQGKPVADASLDHTNDNRHAYQTDAAGRFQLDTRAPAVVIRKPGYQSALVRTQGPDELRITLQQSDRPRAFPTCSNTGRYLGMEGWGARFQFPQVPGVKAGPQVKDIDYGARNYYVGRARGSKGIVQGSGPLWSFGIPLDQDVWRSVAFEEIVFDDDGLTIIDTRGQFASGKRWRQLGKFAETAAYSDVDEATAKTLDRFLDGACLKPAPPQ